MAKHLKILGLGDTVILENAQKVESFVKILLERLQMRLLGTPNVYSVDIEIKKLNSTPFEDEGGVTIQTFGILASATLSTSHIAIHTWPLRKEFHLDIYSCRDFNKAQIEDFVGSYFQCYKMKSSDLTKYTEW